MTRSAARRRPLLPVFLALLAFSPLAGARPDVEPPPGFVALWNGKDLAGWKGLVADPRERAKMSPDAHRKAQEEADRVLTEHWKVEDGVLAYDGKGQSLCTAKDYADFELLVDWKIHAGGDSGIYLRGSPQVQIWDRAEGSGGLFNNQKHLAKPLEKADRAPGEWNTFRIIMVGERVDIYLNDVPVVIDTVLENYWEREKAIYPSGQIELQHHESPLFFRNIFIRELPRAGTEPGPILQKGGLVAITGDSITEQKQYSRFIETYLLACASHLEPRVVQLGWGGERAPGFAARMENDLLPFRPDVVTTCYGMNDGGYKAYDPSIGEAYERSLREIVRRSKAGGARVVVGSPGAVDTFSFKMKVSPEVYNQNLASLRDIARRIAVEEGQPFANVHDAMVSAMRRAKRVLGEAYDVCGSDGFHPQANGHLAMAHAFLKGLGLDGTIGRIVIDLKGDVTAGNGHELAFKSGQSFELESRRYPFCFSGDEKSPSGTRSIIPFLPFNEELNRFTLIVTGLERPRAKVTWGSGSKSFAKEELEAGINLAAEFPENPFAEPFRKLDQVVARKQAFETTIIKDVITRFRTAREALGKDPEGQAALSKVHERLLARVKALQDEARAAVVPVRHTISIRAE